MTFYIERTIIKGEKEYLWLRFQPLISAAENLQRSNEITNQRIETLLNTIGALFDTENQNLFEIKDNIHQGEAGWQHLLFYPESAKKTGSSLFNLLHWLFGRDFRTREKLQKRDSTDSETPKEKLLLRIGYNKEKQVAEIYLTLESDDGQPGAVLNFKLSKEAGLELQQRTRVFDDIEREMAPNYIKLVATECLKVVADSINKLEVSNDE